MKKIVASVFIAIVSAIFSTAFSQEESPAVELNEEIDAETINEAIERGDCVVLYDFVNSQNQNRELFLRAQNELKFYTGNFASMAQYHTDKMESKIRRLSAEIQFGIFSDPENYLWGLVSLLAADAPNDYVKVKRFHDWLCDNISFDSEQFILIKKAGQSPKAAASQEEPPEEILAYETTTTNDEENEEETPDDVSDRASAPVPETENTGQDYVTVLKSKKALGEGFANILDLMCKLAGIESRVIFGFAKDFLYKGKLGDAPDHAWNAVKIGGRWYLVDASFDAGYIEKNTFIKKYSTQYLFRDPRSFLYSHIPQNDADQFYAPVLTRERFEEEPRIEGRFFQKRFSLADDKLKFVNNSNGEFSIEIKSANPSIFVSTDLFANGKSLLENYEEKDVLAIRRKANNIALFYNAPKKGEYQCALFAPSVSVVRDRIPAKEFESKWRIAVDELFLKKKITAREKFLFEVSYFEVEENGFYYLAEDQFALEKKSALEKITRLVEGKKVNTECVLAFTLFSDGSKTKLNESGYRLRGFAR